MAHFTMKLLILFSLIAIPVVFAAEQESSIEDILFAFPNVYNGLIKEIPNLLPTWEQLKYYSFNALSGLPEVTAFRVINALCAIYTNSGENMPPATPNISTVYLQFRTPCRNRTYSLTNIEKLLEDPDFDVNKKTILFSSGWYTDLETAKSSNIQRIAKGYHCRGGHNFLAVNATAFINTLYTWSAVNTEEIGRLIAKGLSKISNKYPVENIHLIGHSLGAHIVGSIGRNFQQFTNKSFVRITALDPANPCFNEGQRLMGVQRGDADFVDVMHTNSGGLGQSEPVGDVDFYPGGNEPIKPGCSEFGCSHGRAIEYYLETVYPGNETDFLATRCTSLFLVENSYCNGTKYPMGIATPVDIKGDYYLPVNANMPFGKNTNGQGISENSTCGLCPGK